MQPFILMTPYDPAVPLANRCTINRRPAPGTRPSDPFPGRLRGSSSKAAIKDIYATDTFYAEITVLENTVNPVKLGLAQKPSTEAMFSVTQYVAGVPLGLGLSDDSLIPVKFILLVNNRVAFYVKGSRMFGLPFYLDLQGGEELAMIVDNTDTRSPIDGEVLALQLFISGVPEYTIETDRKDNPVP